MENRSLEQRQRIWRRRILIATLFCVVMGVWWGISAWLTTLSHLMVPFRDGSVSLLAVGLLVLGVLLFYKPVDPDTR